jgi:hypothetical protein
MSVGYTGEEVGRPGAERRHAHARLAGQPTMHICHERRSLFVTNGNEFDPGVAKGKEEILQFLTWQSEDVFNALDFETFHEEIGRFHAARSTHELL